MPLALSIAFLVVSFFLIILLAFRLLRIAAIFPLLLLAGILLAFSCPRFAPIDEKQHFAYVDFLLTWRRLPLITDPVPNEIYALQDGSYPGISRRDPQMAGIPRSQWAIGAYIYEAIHPPLYYFLAAFTALFIPGGLISKFYFLRILGVLAMLGFAWIMSRSYRKGVDAGFFEKNDFLVFSILSAFALTPGVLQRTVMVGNLQLEIVLCALFYHRLFVMEISGEKINLKNASLLGVLTGCIMATHFFNLTLIILGGVFFFSKKAWKPGLVFLLLAGLIPLPWLCFNLAHYGHLTGWKTMKPMVLDLQNPERTPYGISIILSQLPDFFREFWNPQEIRPLKMKMFLFSAPATWLLNGWLLLAMGVSLISVSKRLFKNNAFVEETHGATHRNFARTSNKTRPDLVIMIATPHSALRTHNFILWCLLGIGLNFLLLVYMGLAESVPTLLGRYLYPSLWPLIFVCQKFMGRLNPKLQRSLSLLLLLCASMLWTNFLVQVWMNR